MIHTIINQSERRTMKALSLEDLLIALAILGILTAIALPNLMPLITKAKNVEAQQQLAFVHTLEQSYFYTHSRYTKSLDELGFEQQTLATDGGTANYLISIEEASESTFTAVAVSVVDFDKDGTFNEWRIDQDKNIIETIKD